MVCLRLLYTVSKSPVDATVADGSESWKSRPVCSKSRSSYCDYVAPREQNLLDPSTTAVQGYADAQVAAAVVELYCCKARGSDVRVSLRISAIAPAFFVVVNVQKRLVSFWLQLPYKHLPRNCVHLIMAALAFSGRLSQALGAHQNCSALALTPRNRKARPATLHPDTNNTS